MQITDSYQEILETLDFIDSQDEAEEITKTILGMIATSLSEKEAREFTAQLPDYLDYKTLRGEPQRRERLLPGKVIQVLQQKFGWNEDDARAALNQVTAITAREAKGEVSDILKDLEDEWKEYFDQTPR